MAPPTKGQTRKYERFSRNGFLVRCYRNMLSRVVGVQKREAQYYQGLPILPKTVFYLWSLGDPVFEQLWLRWQAAGLDRKLTPSIDRIDATLGYTLDNMQWVTHSQNSGRLQRRYKSAAWYAAQKDTLEVPHGQIRK